jgi:beta-galactosidase GanA
MTTSKISHVIRGSSAVAVLALAVGVTAQVREQGDRRFLFVMHFSNQAQVIDLGSESYRDLASDRVLSALVSLERYGVLVLESSDKNPDE